MKKVLLTLCLFATPSTAQDLPPVVADPPPVNSRLSVIELELARQRAELFTLKQQVASLLNANATRPAQVVPAPVPFTDSSTTLDTTVLTVVDHSTFRLDPDQSAGLTYTLARPVTLGTTSGCANGACSYAAPQRRSLFRR